MAEYQPARQKQDRRQQEDNPKGAPDFGRLGLPQVACKKDQDRRTPNQKWVEPQVEFHFCHFDSPTAYLVNLEKGFVPGGKESLPVTCVALHAR